MASVAAWGKMLTFDLWFYCILELDRGLEDKEYDVWVGGLSFKKQMIIKWTLPLPSGRSKADCRSPRLSVWRAPSVRPSRTSCEDSLCCSPSEQSVPPRQIISISIACSQSPHSDHTLNVKFREKSLMKHSLSRSCWCGDLWEILRIDGYLILNKSRRLTTNRERKVTTKIPNNLQSLQSVKVLK